MVIRNYLMFDRQSEDGASFGSEAAGAVINEYKSSISFAEIDSSGVLPELVSSSDGEQEKTNVLENSDKSEHVGGQNATKRVNRPDRKTGMKEDVFSLKEGDVVLQWPERLSAESFQDLQDWTEIVLRKIKRSVAPEVEIAEELPGK